MNLRKMNLKHVQIVWVTLAKEVSKQSVSPYF